MKNKSLHLPSLDTVVPLAVFALLIGLLCYALLFLYKNFYATLAQVENIEVLERTVSKERLNRKVWDAVLAKRMEKLNTQMRDEPAMPARDPFASQ